MKTEEYLEFLAHIRESDHKVQSLEEHLSGTATKAKKFAERFGLGEVGELIGLIHDIGKYGTAFQTYIRTEAGLLNPDRDENKSTPGIIDHSTAGAQWIWQKLAARGPHERFAAKILALCLSSHHSGLIDCISPEGKHVFAVRMNKPQDETHLNEVVRKMDKTIHDRAAALVEQSILTNKLLNAIKCIKAPSGHAGEIIRLFKLGQFIRMLYSVLIDADRTDTIEFVRPATGALRRCDGKSLWPILIHRLESALSGTPSKSPIDGIRSQISNYCLSAADKQRGIYTLTVPTGGGKTLSSLRFALHHAKKHGLERIIYVIPFTTIIDQNAAVVRRILEPAPELSASIVLEHHSNITPSHDTWRGKVLSENWDAPIVFTTNVQLLEALFGGGTRGVRRLHRLANALLIFDEIQALPLKCVHLFNNSINLLVENFGASVVLCTATQPLLNRVDVEKGCCDFDKNSEIVPDLHGVFDRLRRVETINLCRNQGWSAKEIAEFSQSETTSTGSCLIVANTKILAKEIHKECVKSLSGRVFHLSTDLCPAHRISVLNNIRRRLKAQSDEGIDRENLPPPDPFICVSTQLIEAGIDIDFGSVVRCLAGLDSIAQAGGRCNRHGLRDRGRVYILNPQNENLSHLQEIQIAQQAATRVLKELQNEPGLIEDLLSPGVMERYFGYYFHERRGEMDYPLSATGMNGTGRTDSILNLLSKNSQALSEYLRIHGHGLEDKYLNHSFASAGKVFKTIEAPTRGVIVPYRKCGEKLIGLLRSDPDPECAFRLMRRAQRYSVNLFPWRFDHLFQKGALRETMNGSEIYYLTPEYYDKEFGVSDEPVNPPKFLYC